MAKILTICSSEKEYKFFKEMLEPEGYDLHDSNGYWPELLKVHQINPDLIIVNIDKYGFNLLHQLLNHPLISTIPIIVLADLNVESSRLKCIMAMWSGASNYLLLPIDREKLISCVHKHMMYS